jgi:hypothetical protein
MRNFIGIDPGVTGAIAIIDDAFEIVHLSNFKSFAIFFTLIKEANVCGAVIENVIRWGHEGAKSSTTFMQNIGGTKAILEVLNVRRQFIEPTKWQRAFGVSVTKKVCLKKRTKAEIDRANREHKKRLKEKSVEVAKNFYGLNYDIEHNQADALNMARYAHLIFGGNTDEQSKAE